MSIARAYIANLGKYNEGELVGGWIDLPTTDEEIDTFLKDVVKLDDTYEEYAIHDWESEYMSYPGEWVNIYDINEQAKGVAELDDYDLEIYTAAEEVFGDVDITDFDSSDYIYFPECYTDEDIGYYWVDSVVGSVEDATDQPEYYIDEDMLRRDISFDEESNFRYDYEEEHGEDYDEDDFQSEFQDHLDYLVDEIVENPTEYLGNNVSTYFDYERFGRDIRLGGSGGFCDTGFIQRL
jgi:hypothetical protein